MKDFFVVLWVEIWQWLQDAIKMILNIGSGAVLAPRYISNKNKIEWWVDTEEEARLIIENERMLEENPSLALIELVTNWAEILKQIWEKMKSWTNEAVALGISSILWLFTWWAWALKLLWKWGKLAWETLSAWKKSKPEWVDVPLLKQFDLPEIKAWQIVEFKTRNSTYTFEKLENWKFKLLSWSDKIWIWNKIWEENNIFIHEDWGLVFWGIKTSKIEWHQVKDKLDKVIDMQSKWNKREMTNEKLLDFNQNIDEVWSSIISRFWEKAKPSNIITVDWIEFLVTNKLTIHGREQVLAYVNVNWKYEPRLFYFSRSWWNWHSSPWIREEGGYSKWEWWDLSYEKWTVLNPELVNQLNTLKKWWEWFENKELYKLWFKDARYQIETTEVNDSKIIQKWLIKNEDTPVFASFQDNKSMDITEVNSMFKNLDIWWINTKFTKIERWIDWGFHQELKQKITIDIAHTTFNWKPIEIKFWYTPDRPDLIWVEDIVFKDTKINSYWFKTDTINWWLLTTKPLEYTFQLPEKIMWTLKMYWHIDEKIGLPVYSDIRELIQWNPLIQAYKNRKT